MEWHQGWRDTRDMKEFTLAQIDAYQAEEEHVTP